MHCITILVYIYIVKVARHKCVTPMFCASAEHDVILYPIKQELSHTFVA